MSNVKAFADFGIEPSEKGFTGDKIHINKLFNRQIIVIDYRIEDSKYGNPGDKCLWLQIEFKEEKRVVFVASKVMMEMIERTAKSNFPFTTTIIKQDDNSFKFT